MIVRRLSRTLILALSFAASVPASSQDSAASPIIIDLGPSSGTTTQVFFGANSDCSVFGGWSDTSGVIRAFRCTVTNNVPDYVLLDPLPNFDISRGFGISADGQTVVGHCTQTGSTTSTAARWTLSGGVQAFTPPPNVEITTAYAANRDGSVIVGTANTVSPVRSYPFRWTQSSGIQLFDALPNTTSSTPAKISADGSLAGGSSGAESIGFLPGGHSSVVRGVSPDGTSAFGQSSSLNGLRAFRWTRAQGMQDVGIIPGFGSSIMVTSNLNGTLLGGWVGGGTPNNAVLWTHYTGCVPLRDILLAQNLDLTGWVLSTVGFMSDDGTAMAGSGTFNGQARTWLIRNFDPSRLICAADFNLDRTLDLFDYLDFVSAFAANSPSADFNADTVIDFFDYLDFVSAFAAGC
jgi:uncharacterized membrane protein